MLVGRKLEAREFEYESVVQTDGDRQRQETGDGMHRVSPAGPEAEVGACSGTDSWSVLDVTWSVAQCAYQGPLASDRGESQAHAVLVAYQDSVVRPAVVEGGK